jgi:glyoxalase family protein
VVFDDPEGLRHRLVVASVDDSPLIAEHPEVPAEHALQGFDAVRAYGAPDTSRLVLEETLGFVSAGEDAWEARGPTRGGIYAYDEPPAERGLGGAGTVHHVAWSSPMAARRMHDASCSGTSCRSSTLLVPLDLLMSRTAFSFEIATLGRASMDETWTSAVAHPPPASKPSPPGRVINALPDPRPWGQDG